MPNIICLGEMLVEIMRAKKGVPHIVPDLYKGPYPSGAPCIFIDSAARMGRDFGLSTGFIGVVGNDDFGQALLQKLKKDGVDVSQVRIDNTNTTGIAFVQYNEDGSRKFIFAKGAAGLLSSKDVKENYFNNIKNLHIMGSALSISESSRKACYKAIKISKKKNPNVIISFDPNLRPEMLSIKKIIEICKPVLENTSILLPSGEEAEMLAGVKGEDNACKKLLEMGPKIVVLKRGKLGCRIYTKDEILEEVGFAVEEVDPTGAGDSFGGAFIVEYLRNISLKQIMKFSNAVGALKVTSFGPMPDHSRKDVEEFLKNFKN